MRREFNLSSLSQQNFDILIIGGGATGAGAALDAATRGLKVALVERDDFASGTSSKSTKLIHGGVRYLELAIKQRDKGQLDLVREALHERALLLKLAPHLTRMLAIFTPLYSWVEVPYYMAGLKAYDFLAGKTNLAKSRWMSAKETLARFSVLKSDKLKGGILYYDGQFDDARMNVLLAKTAEQEGAVLLNHVEVSGILKESGKIRGAKLLDRLTNQSFEIQAKVVVNATGPYVDQIRKMDDPASEPMLTVSSGVHIMLDRSFCPPDTGLLTPKTEDGRVLFMLPWLGTTLVGTTDCPAEVRDNPKATDEEIDYLIRHINHYFKMNVTRKDILSSWSGLRPLVSNPKLNNTASLSRDHVIDVSPSQLITITGGKWTTYRNMALDAIDEAIKVGGLEAKPSRTESTYLVGGADFHPNLVQEIENSFSLPADVARHLCRAYGDRAPQIAQLAQAGYSNRLSSKHPYMEAEVLYGIREESARTAIDVLSRRMRLSFIDQEAARTVLPRVIELMAQELSWNEERKVREEKEALTYFAG